MSVRKTHIVLFTAVALATSVTTAMAAPNGLYSANDLMDADVYPSDSPEQIGEVEDIVLDNNLAVQAFVVETGTVFGLGGQSYVVNANDVRIATVTQDGETDTEYRVTLDATIKEIKNYPEYSDSWWDKVKTRAGVVWNQTRETAEDTWSKVKDATGDLFDGDANLAQ